MGKLPIVDDFTDPDEVRRCSFLLLACVLILLSIGAVMVYSAAGVRNGVLGSPEDSLDPLIGHLAKIGLGLCLLILSARSDYRSWMLFSPWMYIASVVLLVLVLIPGIGTSINGSRRWLHSSFLPFAVQPSEFAKLSLIVLLAAEIQRIKASGQGFFRSFMPCALLILLPAALILAETDFGTFLLLAAAGLTMLVLAGAPARYVLFLAALSIPALVFGVIFKLPYILSRFQRFGEVDPSSQVGMSLSALSVGGVGGVGLGGGRHKLFYLPESENDFILSVIGEELGFLGTCVIVFMYLLIVGAGIRILLGVRNRFAFFVCAGVLFTIGTQALINIAVATNSTPVKGMPLPFVSSGGSSLCMLCLGVGLILSIARHPDRTALPDESTPFLRLGRRGKTS